MKIKKLNLEIKGEYAKQKGKYIYKDKLILCKRKGSIIEVKENEVIIHADVTGIDKIYFSITKNKVIISNTFKDFLGNEVNKEFMDIQKLKGYVPYPFTLLKNVRKAPPGLITRIKIGREITYSYEASDELKIFNRNEKFSKKNFRKEFDNLLRKNFSGKGLVSSFSGGFDSLFLTIIYKDKCTHILHFSEDNRISFDYYKRIFQNKKWIIIDNEQAFSEKDRHKYFQSVDEPCCDPAGFAEHMMVKEIAKNKKARNLPIMNGQSCDGIFNNGRKYFQEFMASKLPPFLRQTKLFKKNKSWLSSHLFSYGASTKTRFLDFYLSDCKLDSGAMNEIENIMSIYQSSINNDSPNFLAAMTILLRYSVYEIEKIKTASRAFNVSYYLPFMSNDVIQYAFSIPSRHKIGFKHGKRILIKSYPEISKIEYVSRDFKPQKLKERFIGEKFTEDKYKKHFIRNWIKYNQG